MSEINFDNKGMVIIDNIQFTPNSIEDVEKLKKKKGWGLESIKFDIFNCDLTKPVFFGQLDIFFQGIGSWRFIDWIDRSGQSYIRTDICPIFIEANSNWIDYVLMIIEHVKRLHDENLKDLEGNGINHDYWKAVDSPLIPRFEKLAAL